MGSQSPAIEAELHARANAIVGTAKAAGIHIEPVGIAPASDGLLLFREQRDWVLSPVAEDPVSTGGLMVPRQHLETLDRLDRLGIDFPLVHVAHEVPPGRVAAVLPWVPPPAPADVANEGDSYHVVGAAKTARPPMYPLTADEAAALVPPPPPPAKATKMAGVLGRVAGRTVDVSARAVPLILGGAALAGAGLAAAPALALAALASSGLDPIVFGAVGLGGYVVVGEPAYHFALVRWDW